MSEQFVWAEGGVGEGGNGVRDGHVRLREEGKEITGGIEDKEEEKSEDMRLPQERQTERKGSDGTATMAVFHFARA